MEVEKLFRDGVLIDLDIKSWSGMVKLDAMDLGLRQLPSNTKAGHKYLIRDTIMQKFRRIDNLTRMTLLRSAFQFPFGNALFVPKKRFARIIKELEECQAKYNKAVEDLIANYAKYRFEMVPVFVDWATTAFREEIKRPDTTFKVEDENSFQYDFLQRINLQYPEVESLKERFSLKWAIYEISFPKRMKETSGKGILKEQDLINQIQNDYRKEIESKIDTFVSGVVSQLRKETIDLCSRVTENIKDGKVIKGQTLNSLKHFINKFKELNFVGDEDIGIQLDSLSAELLDKQENFKEGEFQTELKRRLNMLREAALITDIDNVTGEYKRKINLD